MGFDRFVGGPVHSDGIRKEESYAWKVRFWHIAVRKFGECIRCTGPEDGLLCRERDLWLYG